MAQSFSVVIRRHPVVMLRNFVLVEILGYGAFLLAGALADYGKLYQDLNLTRVLSYQLAELTLIVIAEILIAIYIFLNWFYTYTQITNDTVLSARGIFFRKKTTVPLGELRRVSHEYNFLGRIFQFGTLLIEPRGGGAIRLPYVMNPQRYAALLIKLKGRSAATKAKEVPMQSVRELLHSGESENLEFKSTLRWDLYGGKVNRQLEKAVMKTVAAFLNSQGGHVVVGVGDRGDVIGLEADYKTIQRGSPDGFENHFTNVFNNMIGAEFRPFVKLEVERHEGKDVCVIAISPSTKPAYLRFEDVEEFYVRTGNTTTSLRLSEAASYLDLWRRRTS